MEKPLSIPCTSIYDPMHTLVFSNFGSMDIHQLIPPFLGGLRIDNGRKFQGHGCLQQLFKLHVNVSRLVSQNSCQIRTIVHKSSIHLCITLSQINKSSMAGSGVYIYKYIIHLLVILLCILNVNACHFNKSKRNKLMEFFRIEIILKS